MPEQSDYEAALNKGERFFSRQNYLLAKREFEAAHRLRPSDALAEKLSLCEEGVAAQNAKEAIKKGRKLEKKGKLDDALDQFEQAQAVSPEDWLTQKIADLRQRIGRDAIVIRIENAEHAGDWATLLATYDRALAESGRSDVDMCAFGDKKLVALVRLERFADALVWAQDHPPVEARARYHLGYAKAAQGAYLEALGLWTTLPSETPTLRPQVMALIPLAYAQASETPASVPPDLYDRLLPWVRDEDACASFLTYFKLRSVDALWRQGQYREIARRLLPLPHRLPSSQLGLYARLFLQLAEDDIEHLGTAITLWLTATYNTALLQRLGVHQATSTPIQLDALRATLQRELEQLIDRYEREGRLDKRLRHHYRTEKRVIATLAGWSLPCLANEVFPCTPAFAARFGSPQDVLERIEAWRPGSAWDESVLSVAVYFSAGGHSLLLAEAGAVDDALAELSKAPGDDRLTGYCRQRVAWHCGIDQALAGNAKGKRYLMEALPLLCDFPHYRKELIDVALGERPFRQRFGLADAMESLARQLNDEAFREAAATLLCQKAIFLANEGSLKAAYKRLVDQAAALCPDCYAVKDTYAQFEKAQYHEHMSKALKKSKLGAAVAVVERSDWDHELVDHFFSTVTQWFEQIEASSDEPQLKLADYREFLQHTRRVDPDHPLNFALSAAIQRLAR